VWTEVDSLVFEPSANTVYLFLGVSGTSPAIFKKVVRVDSLFRAERYLTDKLLRFF